MSLSFRSRVTGAVDPDIVLPPAFRLITLREVGDAFSHAKTHAAKEGAGTLVFVGRFDLVEFAVVLEPDEPLNLARRVFYAGMHALADALAVHAPPEKPIHFDWPDAIRVDDGLVGGGRLAWPRGADENEPPKWLVFGGMIRTVSMTGKEPGLHLLGAALEDEGFDDLTSGRLLETFARHFMVAIDTWQEQGFAPIAKNYLLRLAPEKGVRRDIDEAGDLVIRPMFGADSERKSLRQALAKPSWLDPRTGGPRS
jgi:hypothetical protein